MSEPLVVTYRDSSLMLVSLGGNLLFMPVDPQLAGEERGSWFSRGLFKSFYGAAQAATRMG